MFGVTGMAEHDGTVKQYGAAGGTWQQESPAAQAGVHSVDGSQLLFCACSVLLYKVYMVGR
jgi:hypothetical protein